MNRVIVVGGGQAAGQAAASLRQEGFDGEVRLVAEEPHLPYQRPPLSKQFLAGEQTEDRLPLRPEKFYQDNGIELTLGRPVTELNPGDHRITLADGSRLDYDRLIIATGSRVRRLEGVAGTELDGVHYLRTIEDAVAIKARLRSGARIVVIGGGYIGLEVASVAVQAGASVTLLEAAEGILARVATPELAEFYARVHRERGVDIRTAASAKAFSGSGAVDSVVLDGGEVVPADLVVVGIGIVPNVELAAGAGLACDDGIVVDESCWTSAADILAAGDCTSHPSRLLGRHVRLESVPNAMEQGRVAASAALDKPKVYDAEPWFWSDQYDLKLQMAGFAEGADARVTRGNPETGPFITFHLRQGRVVGVHAVNSMRDFLACRKLVAEGRSPDAEKLADPDVPVKSLLG